MDLTPQAIRDASFRKVKRGYDPDEVEAFRARVAEHVEHVQGQAETMEARARAAVAKLQELVDRQGSAAAPPHAAAAPVADDAPDVDASGEQPEVISRTLLVAQRTAESMVAEAREEAARLLESARSMAARTIDDARHEARRASEDERVRAESEVHALLARRDFLLGDVDQLEIFLESQRERLRQVADHLRTVAGDVPAGLGAARRPVLSASDDTDSFWDDDDQAEQPGSRRPVPSSLSERPDTASDGAVSNSVGPDVATPVIAVSDGEELDSVVPVSAVPVTDDPRHPSHEPAAEEIAAEAPAEMLQVDPALVEEALRIAIDAVHAETEALGVRSTGGAPSPDDTVELADVSVVADGAASEARDAGMDDTVDITASSKPPSMVDSVAAPVGTDTVEHHSTPDAARRDDVDDTWDALRLPVRPLPVDPDWDDDLPVSAAASAAERAARMHRLDATEAPVAPSPQRTVPTAPPPLDGLAERARLRGDVVSDDGTFRVSGDELH